MKKTAKYAKKKDRDTLARKEVLTTVLNEVKAEIGGGEEEIDWSKGTLTKYPGILWRTLFPCVSELESKYENLKCMFSGTSDGFGIHILFADTSRLKRVAPVKISISGLAGKRVERESRENPECKDGLRSITSFKGIIQLDKSFKDGKLVYGDDELENLLDHPVICGDLGIIHRLKLCRQDCGVDGNGFCAAT
jgi:hypothetical protein